MKKFLAIGLLLVAFIMLTSTVDAQVDTRDFTITSSYGLGLEVDSSQDVPRAYEFGVQTSKENILVGASYCRMNSSEAVGLSVGYTNGFTAYATTFINVDDKLSSWDDINPTNAYGAAVGWQFGNLTPTVSWNTMSEFGVGLNFTF